MGRPLNHAFKHAFIFLLITSCGELGLISPESPQAPGAVTGAPLGGGDSGPSIGMICIPGEICENDQRVFVTSTIFPNADLGGLAGADAHCVQAAENAGIEKNFKAILSARLGQTALSRLIFLDGSIYTRSMTANKILVARNSDAFWNVAIKPLEASISYDENGKSIVGNTDVFTGTTSAGGFSGQSCNGWTSAGPMEFTLRGNALQIGETWVRNTVALPCDKPARLYCIEQP
jgi:hypothetical protein